MKNKKIVIISITGIAAVVVLAALLFPTLKQQTDWRGEDYFNDPRTTVVFEKTGFDVGDIANDTIINCTYRFKNTGAKPLIIYSIDPGCYCTNYSVSDKIIQAKGTGEITLSLITEEKPTGMFFVDAVVRMNTKDRSHSLRIEGNIVGE
ncbi:MAG: DUF1573 domain-containing protein [Alistipes sp.]|nr:DUF1573 domain-containing protein [Alistipes sp.]